MLGAIRELTRSDSFVGVLLIASAALALICANSPLSWIYEGFLNVPLQIRAGELLNLEKPLLLWVNDGLMAIFFFLVGLELKRELVAGELSSPDKIALPALAAIGGIVVPSGLYALINWGDDLAMRGWAIPAATDIAFALGILSLLGRRVPVSMKVFLVSLAIIDDIGAILIIALFYTADLSTTALSVAAGTLVVLFVLNRRGVNYVFPYILIGLVLWISVLKSGVHATLAGVVLAFFIPYNRNDEANNLVLQLEHDLHQTVSFLVLPLFAFMNAGVPLQGIGLKSLLHSIPMGIMVGLVVGKTLGVYLVTWLSVQCRLAKLPAGMDWKNLLGVSMLTGVGFTMSIFISSLAFSGHALPYPGSARLGVLIGSTLSAVIALLLLHLTLPPEKDDSKPDKH